MAGIEKEHAAMLVMDYQKSIVASYGNDLDLVARASGVLAAARSAGIPVIYVTITFRDGYPEVGPKSNFRRTVESGRLALVGPDAEIHPGVAPQTGDMVVIKKRVSAFSGSDLELILRSHGIERLYLMGIATSGVVLSTVRQAFDLDYRVTVIADGCGDRDEEVHRVLTQKVFGGSITCGEFQAGLN